MRIVFVSCLIFTGLACGSTDSTSGSATIDETALADYRTAAAAGDVPYGFFRQGESVVFVFEDLAETAPDAVHLVGSFTAESPGESTMMTVHTDGVWVFTVASEVADAAGADAWFDFVDAEGEKLSLGAPAPNANYGGEETDDGVSTRFSERSSLSFASRG